MRAQSALALHSPLAFFLALSLSPPVSLCALALILLLFFSELSIYLTTETSDRLFVDITRGEKLKINFDVTFPHIPCSRASTGHASRQRTATRTLDWLPCDRVQTAA